MTQKIKYEAVELHNIANIMAKLKDGKTLTASDNRALDNYRRKDEGLRPRLTESELAKEFEVDRTGSITRWKKLKAPFDGTDAEMYDWLIFNNIKGATAWKKAFRNSNPGQFQKKKTINKTSKKDEIEIKSAEQLRDEYFIELQDAKEIGDDAREKIALDSYLRIDKQIRDSEAHNKKLGIDRGEVLARSEVERILRAMFWAGNACCDKFSKQIAQRLSDKKPAEVHKILKPTLTALTLFEGLKRVAKTPGDVNLPEWVIECSRTEETQYLKANE
tara:strand:- start:15171 stop:15995 length:825 start_codon:yes stop_codon:yes gene_type:complete